MDKGIKISLLTCFLGALNFSVFAQADPDAQDCYTTPKKILCVDKYIENDPYTGYGSDPDEFPYTNDPNAPDGTSCFKKKTISVTQGTAEENSTWYYFIPDNDGTLEFLITPNSGEDYDWIIFDLNKTPNFDPDNFKLACTEIYDNYNKVVVACNADGGAQVTGAKTSMANGTDIQNSIPVFKGHVYMMCVNRFGGTGGFTLDFAGTSPEIFDVTKPGPSSSTLAQGVLCTENAIKVKVDEFVKCSDINADGSDFEIRDAAGVVVDIIGAAAGTNCTAVGDITNEITLTLSAAFPSKGTYSLYVVNPTAGCSNCTISDLCPSGNYTDNNTLFATINVICADFTIAATSGCAAFSAQFSDNSGATGAETDLTYSWDFGDKQTSSDRNPINTYGSPGVYSISQTITKTGVANPSISASQSVKVLGCGVFYPTAFSPDGANPEFGVVTATTINSFKMSIFDRWGKEVFTSDSQTKKWDGKISGAKAAQGVYAVVITGKITTEAGETPIEYFGTVSLTK